jgi:hypothetical protein
MLKSGKRRGVRDVTLSISYLSFKLPASKRAKLIQKEISLLIIMTSRKVIVSTIQ